jgi:hypothetical protein
MRHEALLIDDGYVRLRVDTYDEYPSVAAIHCEVFGDVEMAKAWPYLRKWREIKKELKSAGKTTLLALKQNGDERWVRFCRMFGFQGDKTAQGFRAMQQTLGD